MTHRRNTCKRCGCAIGDSKYKMCVWCISILSVYAQKHGLTKKQAFKAFEFGEFQYTSRHDRYRIKTYMRNV